MKKIVFLVFLIGFFGIGYCASAEITDISFDNPVFSGDTTVFSISTDVSFYSPKTLYLCIEVENFDTPYISPSFLGEIGDSHTELSEFILESANYDTKQSYDINFLLGESVLNEECIDLVDKEIRKFSVMKKSSGGFYIPENDWILVVLVGLIAMFVLGNRNE